MSTHQIGKHASSVRCYEIKKTPFWPFFMFLACDGYDDAERGKSTGGDKQNYEEGHDCSYQRPTTGRGGVN